jgi:NitT/TauT family transport system permease protein
MAGDKVADLRTAGVPQPGAISRPAFGRRARWLRERPEWILSPLLLLVILAIWQYWVQSRNISSHVVPPPLDVLAALRVGLTGRANYYKDIVVTLEESVLGFAIGSAGGLVLGMLVSQFRTAERVLYPYVYAFQALPKVAIAPLVVIWAGYGITSKVILAAVVTFFPVLVNSIIGFKSVEPERVNMLRAYSASRWQVFTKLALPGALPFVFAGLDMALVYSLLGAIVGEFVGGQRGLGVRILVHNAALDIAGTFAVFMVLAALGVALHVIIGLVRRRVLFWAPSERPNISA